jgi:hypothetical protein
VTQKEEEKNSPEKMNFLKIEDKKYSEQLKQR